ncbi:hypothetical protein [Methanolobus halotolerans]|uniref:tRNA(Ile)-lysidine synthase TilS/MesJ n=1 Tax=Methanolobus halotolerans TaxID=2052935 RepID=A0A4E0QXV6_9EURY|nr:hypothetical protein [Methanolobus halotolerans]TGC08308.1 hypothetical protein CUN85_09525 [Methanolobus halotolerans]
MSRIVCEKCILDSDVPGISIDEDSGLCQFCQTYEPLSPQEKDGYLAQMEALFREGSGKGEYDVIFALSGGKDSSYTLYELKRKYPFLNVMAVQFDNAFISDNAIENAKKMCEITECDYFRLTMGDEVLYDTFRRAALSCDAFPRFAKYRASDICNTCIGIIKQKLVEMSIVHRAPFIVFAFTPGQTPNPIINLSTSFVKWSRDLFDDQLQKIGIDDRDENFVIKKEVVENMDNVVPKIIHPLCLWDYNEERILEKLVDIGWNPPDINDSNSTNCTLNSFACYNHLQKYGIHAYAFDIAGIVRSGDMTREEGLKKLNQELSQPLILNAAKKLNLKVE